MRPSVEDKITEGQFAMILNCFQPGMVIETYFLVPGTRIEKPRMRYCLVMSVHVKGLLVHPFMPAGGSVEKYAAYTKFGRIACDLRNIIESPTAYAVPQATRGGVRDYAKARLPKEEFEAVREISLDCAYNGIMKSERLLAKRASVGGKRTA